jgi:hypothetical protein
MTEKHFKSILFFLILFLVIGLTLVTLYSAKGFVFSVLMGGIILGLLLNETNKE